MSKELISKHDQLYIDIAHRVGLQSYDDKYKVGCVIVRDNNILSMGYNGTPYGFESNTTRCSNGHTKKEVVHSEANALMKLAKNGGGSEDATLYSTHSPCWNCALLIKQAGIKRVVFSTVYDPTSWQFLKEQLGEDNVHGGIQPSSRISSGENTTN